ncbi:MULTISPECIES: sensor histidine kinase [Nostocales]|uniref:histidine kinase n=3 Tax=Nostocales TaxID=1161 RepID=A0A0C1R6F7_9CYAN|nr:sensor histidine kinase [Tolypothrix bouteillei]KAF3887358.1 sensor histidine kinase [Tolypothrix bouteillei VB521301]
MNSITNTSSIRRTLQYIEWTLLGVYLVLIIVNRRENSYLSLPIPTFTSFACLTALTVLSFFFPLNRPMWQKKIYIFLEILSVMLPRSVDVNFEILLYLIIAKSCFLIERKFIVIIVILSGIIWNSLLVWSLPQKLKFKRSHLAQQISELYDTKFSITKEIINDTGGYLAASTFVLLFSFVVIAEQKSRQKAEILTKQVETLAATLERTRIAREIHDSLGHSLTTLDVQLELAQKLYQRDPIQSAKSLDIAKQLANQCLSEVRRSVQTMRQSNFNLNESLSTLVENVGRNQSFVIHLDVKLPQIPVQISHQLYCIVQEGFTNIQKHASASFVSLKGYQTSSGIIIELTDNGQGFEVSAPHSGFGLRGMRERVHILGGEIKINSALNSGTQIQVVIPI